uniref:Uncharacterized protein n=1 Tax=viral metagenome TaxID=1070528 RepID=A0A6C0BCG3_9ZZZZ
MASTIEELRATVLDLKTKLAEAEKELAQMELARPDRPFLDTEMEAMVIALETRTAYKWHWKKVIKDGLLENVTNILEECYYYLIDADSGLDIVAVKAETGEMGSRQWQLFVLKVIQYLRSQGSFHNERTWDFDTFEDTAGGCDEVTQDAAIYLIEHPEWQAK